MKVRLPTPVFRGLATGCAALVLVAVFMAVYSLGYWNGLQAAWNDPPSFEAYQRK